MYAYLEMPVQGGGGAWEGVKGDKFLTNVQRGGWAQLELTEPNCHNLIYYANQSQIEVKVVIQLYPCDMRLNLIKLIV